MKHNLSHHQRLLQKMALTPQMRLSIKILGMSTRDLSEYIDAALAANPFLKKLLDKNQSKEYGKGAPLSATGDPLPDFSDSLTQNVDPRKTLLSQLRTLDLDEKTLEIAEYLIYELDDNGYIAIDLEEAAHDLSSTLEEVQECLETIQTMDPPGIGASDIRECLQLQLKRKKKENSLEYRIVTDFITELAQNDVQKISASLDIEKSKVQEAVKNIKKLNPRPASSMLGADSEKIIPDMVANIKDKKIYLEFNRRSQPTLKLYNHYENELDIIKDPQAREFIKENIDAAKNLIDNLKRREDTLCKVADYILNFQHDAIVKDENDVKSLTITEVARALNFHPSTISRAITNKYVIVNDKTIPLNSLLSHGIRKENGELTSKTAIKKRIEVIIKNEDASRPLGDGNIEEMLKKEGIRIERRTVAKYRHALRILPAYLRKKARSA